jgi:hypothetical protein
MRRATGQLVRTRSTREGQRQTRRWPLVLVTGFVVAVGLAASTYTPVGRLWTAYMFVVLNFYVGVIALVALSITVMAGLLSTDRLVLKIQQRVLLQSAHRATAVIAVVALGVHIAVKVLEAHAAVGDAVIPFYSRGRTQFMGFGTIAMYLMFLAWWTGLARLRFMGRVRPWVWRILHSCAYLCWPIAVLHGLTAGRQAATWVTVSYIACFVFVMLGLFVRIFARFSRHATGATVARAIGTNTQTVIMPRVSAAPIVVNAAPAPSQRPVEPTHDPDRDGEYPMSDRRSDRDHRDRDYRDRDYRDRDYRDRDYRDRDYPRERVRVRDDRDYYDDEDDDRYDDRYDDRDDDVVSSPGHRPRLRLVAANDAPARSPRRAAHRDDFEDDWDEEPRYESRGRHSA